jgi:sensor histidine kinase YesM
MIGLDDEINRLNNYLELEQIRLENKFYYSIEVEDSLLKDNIVIPSMIIQPFAENSIWHGIASIQSNGFIKVKISYLSDKVLKIVLEDNGVGMDNSKDKSFKSKNHLHMGMQMTRKRLVLLSKKYEIDAHVEHYDLYPGTENRGTRIELYIPYSTSSSQE